MTGAPTGRVPAGGDGPTGGGACRRGAPTGGGGITGGSSHRGVPAGGVMHRRGAPTEVVSRAPTELLHYAKRGQGKKYPQLLSPPTP